MWNIDQSLEQLEAAMKSSTSNETPDAKVREAVESVLSQSKDVLSDWLDSKLGSTISDQSICRDLARHYENEFHADMAALGEF